MSGKPRTGRRSRPSKTQRERARAFDRAEAMGVINPVPPSGGLNDFGEPQLGAHQVFVLPSGLTFHVGYCQEVVRIADQDLDRLVVADRAAVGRRMMCTFCRDEGPIR